MIRANHAKANFCYFGSSIIYCRICNTGRSGQNHAHTCITKDFLIEISIVFKFPTLRTVRTKTHYLRTDYLVVGKLGIGRKKFSDRSKRGKKDRGQLPLPATLARLARRFSFRPILQQGAVVRLKTYHFRSKESQHQFSGPKVLADRITW